MEVTWFILLTVFLIFEAITVNLVSVWFAAGSLAALAAGALHAPVWLQVLLFVVISALLLCLLRPFVKKYVKPKVKTNVDAIVGSTCRVTADIDNIAAQGQVKINGMEWSARSLEDAKIPVGTLVRVERVEGVKVYVVPAEVTATK